MMPSFKNTALIFPEISFIQYHFSLSCPGNEVALFATSKVRQKDPTWNRHSSHCVATSINRLCGVDTKTGNFSVY